MKRQLLVTAGLFALLTKAAQCATAGGGLPMEAPIQKLQQSMSGPIAGGCCIIAAVAAFGIAILMGHHWGDFVQKAFFVASGGAALFALLSLFSWVIK